MEDRSPFDIHVEAKLRHLFRFLNSLFRWYVLCLRQHPRIVKHPPWEKTLGKTHPRRNSLKSHYIPHISNYDMLCFSYRSQIKCYQCHRSCFHQSIRCLGLGSEIWRIFQCGLHCIYCTRHMWTFHVAEGHCNLGGPLIAVDWLIILDSNHQNDDSKSHRDMSGDVWHYILHIRHSHGQNWVDVVGRDAPVIRHLQPKHEKNIVSNLKSYVIPIHNHIVIWYYVLFNDLVRWINIDFILKTKKHKKPHLAQIDQCETRHVLTGQILYKRKFSRVSNFAILWSKLVFLFSRIQFFANLKIHKMFIPEIWLFKGV